MDIQLDPLSAQRLDQAKWAYTTRRINQQQPMQLLHGSLCPEAGDLVLARVEELGQHKRLELVSSRRATLFEGDEIVVAYGNRYAPDQFEGIVPDHLGACRLVAAGGVAARLGVVLDGERDGRLHGDLPGDQWQADEEAECGRGR